MKKFSTLVYLIAVSLSMNAGDRTADSLVLVDLYNATNGTEWDSTWNLSEPMANWYGITINFDARVSHIRLQGNNLEGNIPTSLGDLDRLNLLIFRDNKLQGTIPEEIGDLLNLSFLDFGRNELEGKIPESFKNLVKLSHLQLYSNNLSGTFPSDLSGLTKLRSLSWSNNQLAGTIPTYVYELVSLENLSLNSNMLTGQISPSIKNLINLTSISLNNNQFSGAIPSEIGSLSFLRSINISANKFSGPIPEELGNLDSLGSFWASNNNFTSLPQSMNDITRLYYVQASHNKLTSIPDFDPFRLPQNTFTKGLFLRNNQLTFDDLIKNLDVENEEFDFRYVPQNTFDITVTGELVVGQDFSLEVLLEDEHPKTVYKWFKDGKSIMNFNEKIYKIQSVLASDIGRYHCIVTNEDLPNLELISKSFGMANPRLNDSLVLVDFFHAMDGENWNDPWDFNLPMDEWKGVNLVQNRVVELWVFRQNAFGIIPDNFSELEKLNILSLSNNKLDTIPPVLSEIEYLNVLDLSFNQLKGSVPNWIFSMENLSELDLSNNEFEGPLPEEIQNLKFLYRLELGNNLISGPLPNVWDQLPMLENLDLSLPNISLPLPSTLFELSDLVRFLLDGVPFNESFDERIWDLSALAFLSLRDCGLETLTGNVSNLTIKTIILRQNQFETIPPIIFEISALLSINLSQNKIASLPDSGLEKLPNLHSLFLNNNQIKTLPDWSGKINWGTSGGQGLNLSNNLLTFDEIIDNQYLFSEEFSRNRYSPQLPVFINQFDEDIPNGASFIYQCVVDSSISDIAYQWIRNEDTTTMDDSGILLLDPFSISDTGTYHCLITHPDWPDLQLRTIEFHLAFGVTTFLSEHPLEEVKLYPNPLSGTTIKIELFRENNEVSQLILSQFSGSSFILDDRHWFQNDDSISIELEDLPKGSFILSVFLEDGRLMPLKFVKI